MIFASCSICFQSASILSPDIGGSSTPNEFLGPLSKEYAVIIIPLFGFFDSLWQCYKLSEKDLKSLNRKTCKSNFLLVILRLQYFLMVFFKSLNILILMSVPFLSFSYGV